MFSLWQNKNRYRSVWFAAPLYLNAFLPTHWNCFHYVDFILFYFFFLLQIQDAEVTTFDNFSWKKYRQNRIHQNIFNCFLNNFAKLWRQCRDREYAFHKWFVSTVCFSCRFGLNKNEEKPMNKLIIELTLLGWVNNLTWIISRFTPILQLCIDYRDPFFITPVNISVVRRI